MFSLIGWAIWFQSEPVCKLIANTKPPAISVLASGTVSGGDERNRTVDLLTASQTL